MRPAADENIGQGCKSITVGGRTGILVLKGQSCGRAISSDTSFLYWNTVLLCLFHSVNSDTIRLRYTQCEHYSVCHVLG